MSVNGKRTFRLEDGKLAEDPVGHHVVWTYQGRELLGTVWDVENNRTNGNQYLYVNFFDGTPWPYQPLAREVTVLVREETGEEDSWW